jgi:MFS family permease
VPSTDRQSNVDPNPEPITSQSSGRTAWGLVLLAIGSGMLAAVQVGKAHIALMSIRSSFALSLVDASWILSALSFVGVLIAAPIGSVATRFGTKRTLAAGLLILSASSAAGGFAPTAEWLVASRVIEGLGFVLVVVAAPSLIVEVTQRRHIRLALAGWATFMPGGIALATLLAPPLLNHHTWRVVWLVDAGFLAAYVLLLFGVSARTGGAARPSKDLQPFAELRAVITSRGPVLLASIFALYTTQHLGMMGFMPTVLVEKYGIKPNRAGVLVSIAMAANIVGNLAAGVLLQKGIRRSVLIGCTTIFMAAMTIGMFSAHLPLTPAYICCFLFSCVGGIVPGAVISAAPVHSPSGRFIPATNGLLVQGSNLGIVAGPPLISSIVATAGWQWVPALAVIAAFAATVLAVILHRNVQPRLSNWVVEKADIPVH